MPRNGRTPSRISRLVPLLCRDLIEPGTASTSRPRSAAQRAVLRAPLRSVASTTTTALARAAMIRLRFGKLYFSGGVPSGSSVIREPAAMICSRSSACRADSRHRSRSRARQRSCRLPRGRRGAPRRRSPSAMPLITWIPDGAQSTTDRSGDLDAAEGRASRADDRDAGCCRAGGAELPEPLGRRPRGGRDAPANRAMKESIQRGWIISAISMR